MHKTKRNAALFAGAAGLALVIVGPAHAQSVAGSLDGAYSTLSDDISAAKQSVVAAEAGVADATAVLDTSVKGVSDLAGSLTNSDNALLNNYAKVDVLVGQQAQLEGLSAAVDTAQAAFTADPSARNLLSLQKAQTAFNSGFAAFSDGVLDFDSAADPETFQAQGAKDALAGSRVSQSAATQIGNPNATIDTLLAETKLRNDTVTLAQDGLATAAGTLAGAQEVLAPLARSGTLLDAAGASGQESIKLAAGALTGDPAAVGSNYETEVLGALTDHETRIVANAEAIMAESDLRVAGDAATLTSANTYTDTSVAAEAGLRVAGDAATLTSANTYTDTSVAAEAGQRVAGDAATLASANTYTDTSVAAEAGQRVAGDDALRNRIAAEESARVAADNALDTRITNEANSRIAADNVLRDQIASSTATAIALGGAAILPDVNFTLAANVGFYKGAQAIAVNAAARVSRNTYVTGAFGGGLNKHGSVGGRVGVVFGF